MTRFPPDVLDEIGDLIESVSEGFSTCFFILKLSQKIVIEYCFFPKTDNKVCVCN